MKILKPNKSLKIGILLMCCLSLISMTQSQRDDRIHDCASRAGEGTIYLKDFIVNLPEAQPGEQPPMYRQGIILRGNNIYRFNLCNEQGQAIIRLYDSSNLLVSSFDPKTDKEYNPINFMCRKTGQYNIIITFKDGKGGEAVGIMSHVAK